MDPENLFRITSSVVLLGWAALIASPLIPRLSDVVSAYLVPGLLSVVYTALVLVFWSRAEGGFDSLANVATLFETRELLLAGWVHYLAFDLFVGAWIVRTARREAMPFWLALPCLPPTFLFGPAGFLLYSIVRMARRSTAAAAA